jgi:hypothetical protein
MVDEVVIRGTEDNKALVIYEDGDILYICKAAIGAARNDPVWQIKKFDGSAITWAGGNDHYDSLATDLVTVKTLDYF